jgi:2-iminobutanoate/2-iminopropanoate deaminase
MPREEVSALEAPAAIGPYSHAIAIDGFLFCSGQLGLDAKTGQLVDGVENQAERALMNLVAVLKAADMSMADVVKTTIFLADLTHFSTVNEVYSRFVVALVEIEAIARRSS